MAKSTDQVLTQRITSVESRVSAVELDIAALEEAMVAVDFTEVYARLDALKVIAEETRAKVDTLSSGTGGTGGGTTPPPPPPPSTDTNVYPLRMPANVAPGAQVELGTGPNRIGLLLSSQPGSTTERYNVVSVFVKTDQTPRKLIAAQLEVSAAVGEIGGQRFILNGAWGTGNIEVSFGPGGAKADLFNLWWNGGDADFSPLRYTGPALYRGGAYQTNALKLWDNYGIEFTITDKLAVVVPPPPPPPTLEAVIVKDGKTLQELVDDAPADSTITLPAGTFRAFATIRKSVELVGAGKGVTVLDCAGGLIPNGKAILDHRVGLLKVRDLTLRNAKVADWNGAGIRLEVDASVACTGVEFTANQDGMLTAWGTGTVTLTGCHFHDNGDVAKPPDFAAIHEIYINGLAELNISDCIFEAGLGATHAVKSRARKTTIVNSQLRGSPDTTGSVGGSVLDTPNGGEVVLDDVTLAMAQGAGNTVMYAYGADSVSNGTTGVTMRSVLLEGGPTDGAWINGFNRGAPLTIEASTHAGPAPRVRNWSVVTGEFVPV